MVTGLRISTTVRPSGGMRLTGLHALLTAGELSAGKPGFTASKDILLGYRHDVRRVTFYFISRDKQRFQVSVTCPQSPLRMTILARPAV